MSGVLLTLKVIARGERAKRWHICCRVMRFLLLGWRPLMPPQICTATSPCPELLLQSLLPAGMQAARVGQVSRRLDRKCAATPSLVAWRSCARNYLLILCSPLCAGPGIGLIGHICHLVWPSADVAGLSRARQLSPPLMEAACAFWMSQAASLLTLGLLPARMWWACRGPGSWNF